MVVIILSILAILAPFLIALSPWLYKEYEKWEQEKRNREEEKRLKEGEEFNRIFGDGPGWTRINNIDDIKKFHNKQY